MAHSPCFFPLAPLSNPLLLTWNPPSCDRIRSPRSQVACKLTSPFPTLSPNPPPSKFPEPRIPSASLGRPQDESGIFCSEQLHSNKSLKKSNLNGETIFQKQYHPYLDHTTKFLSYTYRVNSVTRFRNISWFLDVNTLQLDFFAPKSVYSLESNIP